MFNPKIVLFAVAFFIGVAVIFFSMEASKQTPTKPVTADNSAAKDTTVAALKETPSAQNFDLSDPEQAEAALAKLQLSPEDAQQKFRQARNEWMADPSLSLEMKDKRVAEFAQALWGEGAVIPEQTAEDLAQQARIRESIVAFKANVDEVKGDSQLTLAEKKEALAALMQAFVRQEP